MNKLLENVMLSAVKNNPNAMNILSELEKSGMSAQDFFYKKAKEMGIDPETILNQLR